MCSLKKLTTQEQPSASFSYVHDGIIPMSKLSMQMFMGAGYAQTFLLWLFRLGRSSFCQPLMVCLPFKVICLTGIQTPRAEFNFPAFIYFFFF